MGTPMDDWRAFKKPGSLKLEDGVATKAAEFCADVLDIIAVVEAKVGEVTAMAGGGAGAELFGNREAGRALAREFFKVGTEFRDEVLRDHKQVLNDMALSFLIAGNNYKNADTDSKDELARILSARNPEHSVAHAEQFWGPISRTQDGWADEQRKPPQERYDKAENNKGGQYAGLPGSVSGLKGQEGAVRPVVIEAEAGESLDYDAFHKLGNSLMWVNWILALSSDWHRMAVQLDRGFTDFDNRIKGLVGDDKQWSGHGAESARDAVYRYNGRGTTLTRRMFALSDNLLDAYNWASVTKANMPPKPASELKPEERKTWETHAEGVFNNWYAAGVEASASAIPVLPGPAGTGKVDETPKNPGNTNPGGTPPPGGGGGANSAGGGGSQNSDAAVAAQLKAQQDAAHKEQIAALQQAEAQRKAQEQAAKDAARDAAQKAAQQQQQQAQDSASQALQQMASQAASQASQIGEQISAAAEQAAAQAAQQASLAGLSGIPTTAAALDEAAKKMGLAGSKGGGAGGGAGGGLGAKVEGQNLEKASKLFPRATATTDLAAMASRAGLANAAGAGAGMPMGGPMGGGGAGAGAGGQQKDHKRADYLDSVEHLEEAIGEAQTVVRPVVEQ
ncbi:hypothetical protein ACSVDM_04005 [Nocardia sp. JW2]|uniref:hypothetical protein n=1 Tax=Nocardia sp. JW2 TaxID=3450738 RepID=UPI003F42E905